MKTISITTTDDDFLIEGLLDKAKLSYSVRVHGAALKSAETGQHAPNSAMVPCGSPMGNGVVCSVSGVKCLGKPCMVVRHQ
jgi:hypothetical protein